jgi:hypothetical protein
MNNAHGQWLYSVKTFFIYNEALWMQVIHENNVVNKTQGIISNSIEDLAKFHIQLKINFGERDKGQFLYNNYVKFPLYYLKKQLKNISLMRRLISG